MEYRQLGKTDMEVSALCVGTWQLSGPVTIDGRPDGFPDVGRREAVRTIQACADLGINVVDTAAIYGGGEGESRVGEALRGNRQRWIVSTKFGMHRGPRGERIRDPRPAEIPGSLEGSLRRLGMQHVDIYMYHLPPAPGDLDGTIDVLTRLRDAGKIRALGVSTASAELAATLAAGGLDVVLFPRSLLMPAREMTRVIRGHRLGGIVRGVFAGGRLSGRHFQAPPRFRPDDIRSREESPDWSKYAAFLEAIPAGMAMPTLALRYVLDFDTTHTVALGATSIEQFREATAALDVPNLDAGTREAIERIARRVDGVSLVRRLRRAIGNRVRRVLR